VLVFRRFRERGVSGADAQRRASRRSLEFGAASRLKNERVVFQEVRERLQLVSLRHKRVVRRACLRWKLIY
jgi:hypothetical protein